MKLHYKYFDFAGRGETTRILLHAAKGGDWTEDRLSFSEWPAFKPQTPLGNIPTLTVDGTEFTQSVTIQRYAAKLAGLYPKDDPFRALIVDEALDVMNECMAKNPYSGTDDEKRAFLEGDMAKYFGLVESRIKQFGGETKDTICGVPSVADIDLMTWVHFIQSGFFDFIGADYFDDYPGILACVKQTAEREVVKAYYASLNKDK